MPNLYRFEFTDEVATADAAFRAWGDNLNELFASCAAALFATIVELSEIKRVGSQTVECRSTDPERLLYEWLSELVYLKDTRRELYSHFEVKITKTNKEMQLVAEVGGEQFNPLRHQARVDVKAVTYHRLKIEETEAGFTAFVILDL
jgi:SHS2 domain-containing protein